MTSSCNLRAYLADDKNNFSTMLTHDIVAVLNMVHASHDMPQSHCSESTAERGRM